MKSRLLTPLKHGAPGGERFAIHVFVPALRYRRENPSVLLPTACLRSSLDGFDTARFFERIDLLGASALKMFAESMPGTGGMAQVLLETRAPVVARSIFRAPPIKTVGLRPDDVLRRLINAWLYFRAEGGGVAVDGVAGGVSGEAAAALLELRSERGEG